MGEAKRRQAFERKLQAAHQVASAVEAVHTGARAARKARSLWRLMRDAAGAVREVLGL